MDTFRCVCKGVSSFGLGKIKMSGVIRFDKTSNPLATIHHSLVDKRWKVDVNLEGENQWALFRALRHIICSQAFFRSVRKASHVR